MIREVARRRELISSRVVFALVVSLALAIFAGVLLGNSERLRPLLLPALAGLLALGAGFAVLRAPALGLALLPTIGAAVPVAIGTGTQSPIVAALLVAGVLIGLGAIRSLRAPDVTGGWSVIGPALLTMLVWVAAFLWSNAERDALVTTTPTFWSAQLGGLGVTIISLGVLVLSMGAARQGPWVAIATIGMIGCGVGSLLLFILGNPGGINPFLTSGLFTMWVVALSLGQALFNTQLNRAVRIGLAVLAAAWIVKALVLQLWFFSGWLPSLVAAGVLIFLRSRRAFLGLLAAVVVGSIWQFEFVYIAIWGTTVAKGDLSRLDIWQQSLDLFAQHPVLGMGPAGYAPYFLSIYAGSPFSMSTHNNYLDVLLQTGVIGLVVFAWLLLALFLAGRRALSRWRTGFRGAFAQSAFAGYIGVLCAMGMGDWFIPFVYNQGIGGFRYTVQSWVFLGFLAGLSLVRDRPSGTAHAGQAVPLLSEVAPTR